MGEWSAEQLKQYFDARLGDLAHRLDGFPQEFATKAEVATLDTTLDTIRTDHIQRREFDEQRRAIDELKTQMDRHTGRRTATVAALGVFATLLALMFGLLQRAQLSHRDVTEQIQTEAPWLMDRPKIEQRISALENSATNLTVRVGSIDTLDRFFCRTRAPKLPAC